MKANDLSIQSLLQFQPDKGQILLQGARVLLQNADALGVLRKDLISTLGLERAKGFLIRYGWACGYNDAQNISAQFAWDNDTEGICAGPVLHTLEGIARMNVETVEIDRETKHFLLKGNFTNSVEAEQHLRSFGTHDTPVCWMFIGYAGGFACSYFGERVIYKEVKCMGKGDPYCEHVGRTVAEWGDEIADELPYYEEQNIGAELETAQMLLQSQDLYLRETIKAHRRLAEIAENNRAIANLSQLLSLFIKDTVFIFDKEYQVLSAQREEPFGYLSEAVRHALKKQQKPLY